MAEEPSWQLMGHEFDHSTSRLLLQVDILNSNWINLIVERSDTLNDEECWKNQLFNFFENSVSTEMCQDIIHRALESCRQRYRDSLPQFGSSLFLRDICGQTCIIEEMDPELNAALRTAREIFGNQLGLPPLISRTELQVVTLRNGSFMAQTKPVQYRGKIFVAKGPASAERALDDLKEVTNLLSLPSRHPNILPPPAGLVQLSNDDHRICGFLTPFYEKGNVDRYARRMRQEGRLLPAVLRTWFEQLVWAVEFLIGSNTWHGDIKPDNILVSDSEELILIDLSRKYTTMAIASPEVCEVIKATGRVEVPAHWPISKIEKSEVYSIARTMFFLSEGISMMDIYHRKGPEHGSFPTTFSDGSSTPPGLRDIISDCLKEDPFSRPALHTLDSRLKSLHI